MQHQTCSELQGASARRTTETKAPIPVSTLRTSLRSSRLMRGSGYLLHPQRGGFLWAGLLLLWALVVPGAWSQLTEEQQETIVELHNYYRGQVSPSATAMMPLKWDTSLKVLAEGYAAKCIWNHNPELEETGENLFAGTGLFDPGMALEKWFLEHLDFDYSNNSCPDDKMCGHYTQMVWADTHRVGCALHLCDNMEGLDFEKATFLVCNYYPAGNYEKERPYEEGDWCSRCPENLQKCQDNLCVSDGVEPEEEEEEEEEEDEVMTETPSHGTSGSSFPPATPTPTPTHQNSAGSPHPATLHPAPDTDAPFLPYTTTPSLKEEEGEEEEEEKTEDKKEEDKEREGEKEREREREISYSAASSISTPVFLLSCLTVVLCLRL